MPSDGVRGCRKGWFLGVGRGALRRGNKYIETEAVIKHTRCNDFLMQIISNSLLLRADHSAPSLIFTFLVISVIVNVFFDECEKAAV